VYLASRTLSQSDRDGFWRRETSTTKWWQGGWLALLDAQLERRRMEDQVAAGARIFHLTWSRRSGACGVGRTLTRTSPPASSKVIATTATYRSSIALTGTGTPPRRFPTSATSDPKTRALRPTYSYYSCSLLRIIVRVVRIIHSGAPRIAGHGGSFHRLR